jgi:3-deoxy-D-manno-octulosonic-acid transferase
MRLLPEPLRWFVYTLLHRIINGPFSRHLLATKVKVTERYIWIFCSTIGELNACKLLVQQYCSQAKVLLLTDREIYLDSFKTHFPMAEVAVANIDFRNTELLISRFPAQLAIVCEIPVLLHDAPCRLSYGVLRTLKKHQVHICLVNGWLYGYKPACKQDSIEKLFFEQDYLNCFDVLSVQTETVKQTLLAKGINTEKVIVTGNMKYDNLDAAFVLTTETQILLDMLKPDSVIFVAGCLTDVWEYQLVVSAFATAKQAMPQLKLIIAPRHPEKPEQLQALTDILQQNNFQYAMRSKITSSDLPLNEVLIIDTFGELKAFYSIANVCYVGINHNILEPLSLNKPVAVLANWEKSYPSYPVYKIAEQAQMVTIIGSQTELSEFICGYSSAQNVQDYSNKLRQLSGALAMNIELINRITS